MNKYVVLQQGGQESAGADVFNDYVDQLIGSQQEPDATNPQQMQEQEEQDTEYIQSLREYDADAQNQSYEQQFNDKFEQLTNLFDQKLAELQGQQSEFDWFASEEGNDYLASIYDTQTASTPQQPGGDPQPTNWLNRQPQVQYQPATAANVSSGQFTRERVQRIVDKYTKGKSPLRAEDFIEVANKYGVPIDLMLAQGIQESNLGTAGMAVRTKNIYNVGNNGNTGKTEGQNSFRAGLERYAALIRNEYAKDPNKIDSQEIINSNFTRPRKGGQYAEDDYGPLVNKVLQTIHTIK